jgi:hypothetical protein
MMAGKSSVEKSGMKMNLNINPERNPQHFVRVSGLYLVFISPPI